MEILLKKHELLDLGTELRGLSLFCQAGTCWLTQAGDSRDHILRVGHSFTATLSGHLVVTATEDCRLSLIVATAAQECGSFWQRLVCSN